MKTPFIKTRILLASLFLAAASAGAEDIDIYAAPPPDGARPNVLVLIDNAASNNANYISTCSVGAPFAANTTKLLDMVQCGIYAAIKAIGTEIGLRDRLNVGLMQYGAGSNPGGKWWAPSFAAGQGPDTLPFMDDLGVKGYLADIYAGGAGMPTSNSRAAPSVMQEAWAFFNGQTGLSTKRYAGFPSGSCSKNFIIFIGAAAKQGAPATGNGNVSLANAAYGATALEQTQINTGIKTNAMPNNTNLGTFTSEDYAWTDEWARFLKTCKPQSARTYTIAAAGTSEDYSQHLRSMAGQGGGKAFVASSAEDIKQALLQIFNEVQAVNSVFASSSLPVSVNAQGTFLNQIFMGMFRPDPGGAPRWFGNLKQFQFGVDLTNPASPTLFLADSTGDRALSAAGTGFISANATSFWTKKNVSTAPDSTGGFFLNNPQGASGAFDSPDGEVVEKGGAGQQIRLANLITDYTGSPASPRRLYTCTGACAAGSSLSGTPFATSNSDITQALLGTGTPGTPIATITRTATLATVTMASAPSPALVSGNTVSISGSSLPAFNGTFNASVLTSTSFTHPVQENPPTTAANTYTASIPGAGGIVNVASLRRAGLVVTANAISHGFSTGNTITITGASTGYNGTVSITRIDANNFTYTLPGAESPTTPGGGGTTTVGGVTRTINTAAATPPGIVRGPSNSSNVAVVTVCTTANHGYATGNTVTIVGALPNDYNGTWGTLAPAVASLNPAGITRTSNRCFTFNIPTRPVSPATGSSIIADGSAIVFTLTSLVRSATTCPTSTAALATATVSGGHSFITGNNVSIAVKAGSSPTTGEGGYVGTYPVTVLSTTQFTYPITVLPACASAGGTVSQSGVVDRETLIRWVRGEDNFADEPSPGGTINIRPSIHGDVLHSRPTVINYGGTTGVVVFYGTNDGVFRAVNGNNGLFKGTDGNIVTNIGTSPNVVPPGGEMWGFVPTEFYSKLFRLRQNTPIVKFATTAPAILPAPVPKDYFFDGPTGVYQKDSTAYIYMAARRGGRVLYALDVSNPSTPNLLWKKTNASTGFAEMGQTWSQPTVVRVRGYVNPVLVFGAGYDTNQDSEPPGTDTMGRGIFILDAVTGNLLWRAGPGGSSNTCTVTAATAATTGCQLQKMVYSIPADITPVDRNFDGCIDRIYAADTGGNIWRVDLQAKVTAESGRCGDGTVLAGAEPKDWQTTLFAELGGASSDTTKRKLFFPPDVVTTKTFDVVLATTGDREHPLRTVSGTTPTNAYAIYNKFYMIKDTIIGNDAITWTAVKDTSSSALNLVDATSFFDATSTPYNGSLKGFAVKLGNIGEKGVNAPATVGGFTFFGTNQPVVPEANSCEPNLGTARGYRVNFLTGEAKNVVFDGGGLPPSPVTGLVEVTINGEIRIVPFIIGGGNPDTDCVGPDCLSALGGLKPAIPIKGDRRRTFWYQERDK